MRRLDVALGYGADAVYLAGKKLGMRAACKNFDNAELKAASLAAHSQGKRFYVTVNIFPFDDDLYEIDEYLDYLASLSTDGIIVSDLGLIAHITKRYPNLPVHVSTQANVTNSETARLYANLGASRIVLARELSIERIAEIRSKLDKRVELEAFVHGAMCISYSGRCLLSAYISGRSANRGECNQACRMNFEIKGDMAGEQLEFVEDDGTYIFGGNDLNMIEHLDDVINAGVTSLKIEGRVKSEYYVGCIVNAYRKALDAVLRGDKVDKVFADEVAKAPNRGFNTGFYYGMPERKPTNAEYYDFCGMVVKNTKAGCVVEMRNRFKTGDQLEVLSPDDKYLNSTVTIPVMQTTDGEKSEVTDAKITLQRLLLPGINLPALSMLRRKRESVNQPRV
ncbi:MAG: U32 family peptidase [Clostridiales bacterium]|nr:U32 family peptidase [Clostridiales bacterium]